MPVNRITNLAGRLASSRDQQAQLYFPSISGDRGASDAVSRRTRLLQKAGSRSLQDASPLNPFDVTIECLLAVLLLFSALAYGATEAWSQEVALALSGAALLVLTIKLAVQRDTKIVWSWAYAPIGLFGGLIAIQLLTLPSRWISVFSPEAVALPSRLLGWSVTSTTLSLDPLATQHQLQLPFCAIAVFVVVLNVYQRPEQVVRLLGTIAVVAAPVILLELYQNVSGSRLIYGLVPAVDPNSGPFMNYGHYAQFTNLSLGASFGLLLYQIEQGLSGGSELNFARLKTFFAQRKNWPLWLLTGELVLGAITIFLSMSRGGVISLIGAGTGTSVLIAVRGSARGRGTLMFLLAIVALVGLLYAGFDSVYDRLATFRHIKVAQGGRWEILRDLRPLWAMFPLIGTGLGTHQFVFPMFDRSTSTYLATFAENEYAQSLEETGLLGLGIVVLFLSIILGNLARLVWNPVHRLDSLAYGLLFAIVATVVHSFSDFGQHVPAIALLTASICALVLVLNRIRKGRNTLAPQSQVGVPANAARWRSVSRWISAGAVLLATLSLLSYSDRARAAQAHEGLALAAAAGAYTSETGPTHAVELALLDQARQAVALEPSNVSFRLNLACQRWEEIAARSHGANQNELTLTAESVDEVREIVRDLKSARRDCPTFGPLYSFTGQLEKFVLKDRTGDTDIREGAELTSYDANVCFLAGQLDASEKHWDLALARMHRAVDLSDSFRERAIDALAVQDQRPDLAMAFAAGHRYALIHLSELLANDDRYRDLSGQLRSQAFALLQVECQGPDASPSSLMELGDEYQDEKHDDAAAIELYRRALNQDYGQVDWRLKLADALAKTHRAQEAIHEARICLQLHPALKTAEDLIAELSVRPDGAIDR